MREFTTAATTTVISESMVATPRRAAPMKPYGLQRLPPPQSEVDNKFFIICANIMIDVCQAKSGSSKH